MFKRYLILLGAKSTAGGTVKTAGSFMSCDDVPYALEGDLLDCPGCGKQGIIQCVAPRLDDTCDGKQLALEHDLCLCGCSPPPRLIANQEHEYQLIDDTGGIDEALEAIASRTPSSGSEQDAAPLQLIRDSNEQPFRHRHYILELPGRKIEGVTDADGYTRPLTSAERDALIAWHVEADPAPGA
ncbi:MAG: hypothetical protein JWP72_2604 [Massilia sp.]|nr:hypothetical protein [Massilia sp.]MDB5790199.1 hypothetical protein [Massilia sp.]